MNTRRGWWIICVLLFSMLPAGFAVTIAGRTPTLTMFDFLLPTFVLFLVFRNFSGSYDSSLRDRAVFLLGNAYLGAHLLSMLFNYGDMLRGILAIKIFACGLLTYWVAITTIHSRPALQRVTDSLVLWGAVLGAVLVYKFVTDWSSIIGMQAGYEAKEEIGVSMGKSNYLAALMVPLLPLAASGIFAKHRIRKLMMVLAVVVMSLGVLITMSKGAIVSLTVGLICGLPQLRKVGFKPRNVLAFLAIVAVFFVLVPTNLVATNYEMFSTRLENPDWDRVDLFKIAWREFVKNPVLGVGPNSIYLFNRQYVSDDLYTHNFVLNVLAELGLVGSIPFFTLIFVLVRRSYKLCTTGNGDRESRCLSIGLFIGLIATLAHGLVEPTFAGREYSVIFWVYASLIFLWDPSRSALGRIGVSERPAIRFGSKPVNV